MKELGAPSVVENDRVAPNLDGGGYSFVVYAAGNEDETLRMRTQLDRGFPSKKRDKISGNEDVDDLQTIDRC